MAADDLGKQLELQQQLNKLLKEQAGLLRTQGTLYSKQAGYAKQMCDAMDCAPFDRMNDKSQELTEGLKDASDQAKIAGDSLCDMKDDAEGTAGALSNLADAAPKIGAISGLLVGFGKGVQMYFGLLKTGLRIVGNLVGSFLKLGQTMIMLPFKMLTGLIKMSQRGGIDPLRQALEEVRDQFGNLATNEGKMFVDSVKETRKQMGNLAGTGLSLSRVFGFGRKGLAEIMKYNQETAKAMGSAFGNLGKEFAKMGPAIAMYRKALGMSAEQQADMIKLAKARGQSLKESQLAFASMAVQMGEKFGMNAKKVGQAMAEMKVDVSSFGHLSNKAFASTAVYAAKLGIEVKDMMGVFEKFDNFENATKGAAELSQAFGMNVDSMAMLKAETPAQQIDVLRKSFFAAGKSLKDMNRHQRAILESSTNLKGAALEAAFANENMGMSYENIQAGAEDAEKKQLSQGEVMRKLAKDIRRDIKDGQHQFTSFFDSFSKGFEKGILRSMGFRNVMRDLQRSLRIVHRAGYRVGKMFVDMFPGIKDTLQGIRDLFRPKIFRDLMKGVKATFKSFFKMLKDDPKNAVKNFADSMRGNFLKYFGIASPAIKKILDGMKTVAKTIVSVIAGIVPMVITKLTDGFKIMAEKLKGEKTTIWEALKATFKDLSKKAEGSGIFFEIFQPIIDVFKDGKLLNEMGTAFMLMFDRFWAKFGDDITKKAGDALGMILKQALVSGIGYATAGLVGGHIVKRLFGGAAAKEKLAEAGAGLMSKVGDGIRSGAALLKAPLSESMGTIGKGLKAAVTRGGAAWTAGALWVGASLGKGIFDGVKKYQETGDFKRSAGQAFGGFISTLTFGLMGKDADEAYDNIFNMGQKQVQRMVSKQKKLIGDFRKEAEVEAAKYVGSSMSKEAAARLKSEFRRAADFKALAKVAMSQKGGDVDLFKLRDSKSRQMMEDAMKAAGIKFEMDSGKYKVPKKYVNDLKKVLDKLGDYEQLKPVGAAEPRELTSAEKALQAQAKKVEKLEAAANVVSRLQELSAIPKEMKKLEKTMKGIDPDALNKRIDVVFTKAAKIVNKLIESSRTTFGATTDFSSEVSQASINAEQAIKPLRVIAEAISEVDNMMASKYLSKPKRAQDIVDSIKAMSGIVTPIETLGSRPITTGMALEGLKTLGAAVNQVDMMIQATHLANPKHAKNVVKSIKTMAGIFSSKNVKTAEAISAFSGGELIVRHTIPNTHVQVVVQIDAETLGKKIAKINIGQDNATGNAAFSVHQGPPSTLVAP
jgi:hypothetical protein